MSMRRISQRTDTLLGRPVALRHNKRLQFVIRTSNRSTSTIPVTRSTPIIPPKYHDPALFAPQAQPKVNHVPNVPPGIKQSTTVPNHILDPSVPVTLYSFPSFQPLKLLQYPATHLYLPLRRDLLHRAVTFEGDASHPSTVWTPHRKDHPGSGRKLHQQKGTGRARVGDSSSPILKGGIKTFGPKPRDMSTGLPKKIYHRAWRTALSWRYKKGELVVVKKILRNEMYRLDELHAAKYVETFGGHGIGSVETKKPIPTTWIVMKEGKKDPLYDKFARAMSEWWPKDKLRDTESVDVKNLLEGQRVVIEFAALNRILKDRQSDLPRRLDWQSHMASFEVDAENMQKAAEETKRMQAEMEKTALETIKRLRSRPARRAAAKASLEAASTADTDGAQVEGSEPLVVEAEKS